MDSLNQQLIPIQKKLADIKQVTKDDLLPNEKNAVNGVVSDTRKKVDAAEKQGKNMYNKLIPIATAINKADPQKIGAQQSNVQVAKALADLKKIRPQLDKFNANCKETKKAVDNARTNVDGLETNLVNALKNQIKNGLDQNDNILVQAQGVIKQCDIKIDELDERADEALRRFPPSSLEGKKFNDHKKNLKEKTGQVRGIIKRKFKEDQDQLKMRTRLALQVKTLEPLVQLDKEVKEGEDDCKGVNQDAVELLKKLKGLDEMMLKDQKKGKMNKLEELQKKLYAAKKDLADVDDKSKDFQREETDLENALGAAIPRTQDPTQKKKLENALKDLQPMKKEVNVIHGDVPREATELAKIEDEIKKLDINNPDPAKVDELFQKLNPLDDKIKKDEKKVDELRNKLHPIDKLADDAHKALGDTLHGAERDSKGLDDDLKEINKKLDRIKKKIAENEQQIDKIKKDPYKDKQRQNDLIELQKQNATEKAKLNDQLKNLDDIKKKHNELKKKLQDASKNPKNANPDQLQKDVQDLNKVTDALSDRGNQLESEVDQTRDQLNHLKKKYDDKRKRLQDQKAKAANEDKLLDELLNKKIPGTLKRLNDSKNKLKNHPNVANPQDQKKLDAVKKAVDDAIKETGAIDQDAKKVVDEQNKQKAVADSVPTKVTSIDDLDKASKGIDKVDNDRQKLEQRLKIIDQLADTLDKDIDKLQLKDGFDSKAGNDLMANNAIRKLDDAQKKLDDALQKIDDAKKLADEVCKKDPQMKPKADKLKKQAETLLKARDDLQKKKDVLKKQLEDLKKQASKDPANIKKQEQIKKDLANADKEAELLNDNLDHLLKKIDQLDDDFQKAKQHVSKQKKVNDQANRYKNVSDDLEKKLKKLDQSIKSFTPVQAAMADNVDYADQFQQNDRLKGKLKLSKDEHDRIAAQKKKLDQEFINVQKKLQQVDKLDLPTLDSQIDKLSSKLNPKLEQLHIDCDNRQNSLYKKREKMGDCKIKQHSSVTRPQDSQDVQNRISSSRLLMNEAKQKVSKSEPNQDAVNEIKLHETKLKDIEDRYLKLRPQVPELQQRIQKHDFAKQEINHCAAPINELRDLGDKFRKLKSDLIKFDENFDKVKKNADELQKKADEAKNNEMLQKMDDLGKINELKMARQNANRAMQDDASPVESMIKDVGKKKDQMAPIQRKFADLKKWTDPRLGQEKKQVAALLGKTRENIDNAKNQGKDFMSKYTPIKQAIAQADPDKIGQKKANEVIAKANDDWKKLQPQLKNAVEAGRVATKGINDSRNAVDKLEDDLRKNLTKEVVDGLKENDQRLKRANNTLKKCDEKIGKLDNQANVALKRFPPTSPEGKRFDDYKKEIKDKSNKARDIDRRKFKEESDQSRMRDRLKGDPSIEPLSVLARDVAQGKADCVGVEKDADQLFKSLNELEDKIIKDAKLGKRNKLQELKKKLNDAKKDLADVDDKSKDFLREEKDLEDALNAASQKTNDPASKKKLEDAKKQLQPMKNEVNAIHADVPKENSDIAQIQNQIKKLDPHDPNPQEVDKLLQKLIPFDDKIKKDEKKIDELRNKLHPIDKLADDAHKSLGDTLHGAARDSKGLDDDLAEINKKLDRIKRKVSENEKKIDQLKKDPYKDKQKQNQLALIQKENAAEKARLNEQIRNLQDAKKQHNALKKKLDDAIKNNKAINPDQLQKEIQDLNKGADVLSDRANKLENDVDQTKDKLDALNRKYDEKKKRVDNCKAKARSQNKLIDDLNMKKVPETMKRLQDVKDQINRHPKVVDPQDQKKLDKLKEVVNNSIKQVQKLQKQGADVKKEDLNEQGVLDNIPSKETTNDDLDKIDKNLNKNEQDRKALEEKLNDLSQLADTFKREADAIQLKDGIDAKAGNDLMANKGALKLDDAQKKLDDALKKIDKAKKLADEVCKQNPQMKPKADKLKKQAEPLLKARDDLQKKKDALQKQLDDLKKQASKDPSNIKKQDQIRKDLAKALNDADTLDKNLDDLHKKIDELDDDFEKAQQRQIKENDLLNGVNKYKSLTDELQKKLIKLNQTGSNMAPVQSAIKNNPDFEDSQNENNRFQEKLKKTKVQHDRIAADKKKLDKGSQDAIKMLPVANQLDVLELDELNEQLGEIIPTLQKLVADCDKAQDSLDRKRVKLGDCNIPILSSATRPRDSQRAGQRIDQLRYKLQKQQNRAKQLDEKDMGVPEAKKQLADNDKKLISLNQRYQKLKPQVGKLQTKLQPIDFSQEPIQKAAAPINQLKDLGIEFRKLNGQLDQVALSLDDVSDRIDDLGKKADKANTEELMKKMDDIGKINQLKSKMRDANRAMNQETQPIQGLVKDVGRRKDQLLPIEKKLAELKRLTDPRLPDQKTAATKVVQKAKDDVQKAKELGSSFLDKYNPIKKALQQADPEKLGQPKANQIIAKANDDWKKLQPQLRKAVDAGRQAHKGIDDSRNKVDKLQKDLMIDMKKQIEDGLKKNDKALINAKNILQKADAKIDSLNDRANVALKRFPPNSQQGKKFDGYKKDLRQKGIEARNIDKRKHKQDADQDRMKNRLQQDPQIEPLSYLAKDVKIGDSDCIGVEKDADALLKSLNDLQKLMDKDEKLGKRNKLQDLKKKLYQAKKDLKDVNDKCDDFQREAKDVEEALDAAIPGIKDPGLKNNLDALKKKLNDPLKKQANQIHKRVPISQNDLDKINDEINKLEAQSPDPQKVDDLRELLDDADRRIKKDEKRIDQLKNQLKPIDKAADDAHKALGDSIRGAQRDIKALDDDLRDLERKNDRIKKKLDSNQKLIKEAQNDPYKDKECENKLDAILKEHEGQKNQYLKQKKDSDDLRKRHGDLRKKLDIAKKDPSKVSPQSLQKEIADANAAVNDKNDESNHLETEVDETKDKLDFFNRYLDQKKKKVAETQRKANDEERDLERLNKNLIPDALKKLDNAKNRLDKLPPTNSDSQKKADDLKKALADRTKNIKNDIQPLANNLIKQTGKDSAKLKSIPTNPVMLDEVSELAKDLDDIQVKRIECEHALKEPDRLADQANRMADDVMRDLVGNKDLNNKLKAQDLDHDLKDAQKKIDEINKLLDDADSTAQNATNKDPAFKPKADALRKLIEPLRKRDEQLQKKKDDIQKQLNAAKSAPPEEANKVEKELQKFDQQIDDLHKNLDKALDDAKKLNLTFGKDKQKHDELTKFQDTLGTNRNMNDDLVKKLRLLNNTIDCQSDLIKSQINNIDYDFEQPGLHRYNEKLGAFQVRSQQIDQDRKKVDANMKQVRDQSSKIGQWNTPDIQGINQQISKNMRILTQLHKDVDSMQNSLDKKRQKQYDHNIPENIGKRPKEVKEAQNLLDATKGKLQKLKNILAQPDLPGTSPNRHRDQLTKKSKQNEKLLNGLQKELDTISKHSADLGPKYSKRDFPNEDVREAIGPIKELHLIAKDIRDIKERIQGADAEIQKDLALAQNPEQKDRILQDVLGKLKLSDVESEFMRKKYQFEQKQKALELPLAVDAKSIYHSLNDLDDIDKMIESLKKFTRLRKPQQIPILQNESKDYRLRGIGQEQKVKVLQGELKPLRDFVRSAQLPKLRTEDIQDKIEELKKHEVPVNVLNKESDELQGDVEDLKKRLRLFEQDLKGKMKKESGKQLDGTNADIKKVDDKVVKAATDLDNLKKDVEDKMKNYNPESVDFKKLQNLKDQLEDEKQKINELEKAKHKAKGDQVRMDQRLADNPGVEGLAQLADQQVPKHVDDVKKLLLQSDKHQVKLNDLMKKLKDTKRDAAKNALDDLKKRLEKDKLANEDLGQNLNSLDRDAGNALRSAQDLQKNLKDPEKAKRMLIIAEEIQNPIIKETHELQKDKVDNIGKKQLAPLEAEIYKINPNNPDEEKIAELKNELDGVEDNIKKDNQRANELRDMLRPLKNQVEDIERLLGDKKSDLERVLRNLKDDLRDLDKKIASSDKNLKQAGNAIKQVGKMEPNDAEREVDVAINQKKMTPTVDKLAKLKKNRDELKKRYQDLENKVGKIDPDKPDAALISSIDTDVGELSSDIAMALGDASERMRDSEGRKQEAEDILVKHNKKIIDKNDTISKANKVNDRLSEVDQAIGVSNQNLNVAQQSVNKSNKGPQRDALQKRIDQCRAKQENSDAKLKLLFKRFNEITSDIPKMDKVVVTSNDLKRKQKELQQLLKDLDDIDAELIKVKKQSNELKNLAKDSIQDEHKGILDDLRKRADDDQNKLNQARDKIQIMDKKLDAMEQATNQQLQRPKLPKAAENKLQKILKDILDDKKKIQALQKTGDQLQQPHMNKINKGVREVDPSDPAAAIKIVDLKKKLDDIQPKIDKLNADVDIQLQKLRQQDDQLGRIDRLIQKENQKAEIDRKTNALGQAASFSKDLQKLSKNLEGKISGQKRLLKAMTNNPDYSDTQQQVLAERQKLKQLEERLQDLKDENQQLSEQIGPMLRGQIPCDPKELEQKMHQMKEKMDEDHNEINDFDQQLEAMRAREKDVDVPKHIAERQQEINGISNHIQKLIQDAYALQQKLKHHDEYCDLPGQLDDIIRDQVREDLKKVEDLLKQTQREMDEANSDLNAIKQGIKGKDLKKVPPEVLAVPVEQLAKLHTKIEELDVPLKDIEVALKRGDEKLADLDLDKMVFDRENDLGNIEKRVNQAKDDLRQIDDLSKTLQNAPRGEDDQNLLKDIFDNLDSLKHDTINAEKKKDEIKDKIQDLKHNKEQMVKFHQDDPEFIKSMVDKCNEADFDITDCHKRLDDIEKRLKKLMDKVAKAELENKHDDTRDSLNQLNDNINEMDKQLQEMEVYSKNKPETQDEKVALDEINEGLPKAKSEVQLLKADRDNIKKSLDIVKNDIKKNPKPRVFRVAKPIYKNLKEIDRQLNWLKKAKVDTWNKNFEQLKKARQAADRKKIKRPKLPKYTAVKNDQVDQMLADFYNDTQCQVPIKRVGNGYYYFGSKKIFAKIINGKLVIRVGGGYMSIEQFVAHYAQQQMNRIEQRQFAAEIAKTSKGEGDRRTTVAGIQKAKKSLANRRSTMRVTDEQEQKQMATAGDVEKMLRDMERKGAASPGGGYRRISVIPKKPDQL